MFIIVINMGNMSYLSSHGKLFWSTWRTSNGCVWILAFTSIVFTLSLTKASLINLFDRNWQRLQLKLSVNIQLYDQVKSIEIKFWNWIIKLLYLWACVYSQKYNNVYIAQFHYTCMILIKRFKKKKHNNNFLILLIYFKKIIVL